MTAESQPPGATDAVGAAADPGGNHPRRVGHAFVLRYGWLIIVGSTVLILIFGLVIDVVMARVVPASTWQNWGNVGQAFEAVAAVFAAFGFAALVVTFLMQLKELQLQRKELSLQRHEMSQTQAELHRSAEADLRRLHVELLRMAIDDEELGAVWPDPDGQPHSARRQFWYANLIYHHQRLALELGQLDEEAISVILRWLFRNPIMREYWKSGAEPRAASLIRESKEWQLAQLTDAICSEYDDEPPDRGLRLVE